MRVFTLRSARAHTLPPRPPSPPSGPPRGTYFSRRKLAEPSPPLPACTSIFASSMNFMVRNEKALPASIGLWSWERYGLRRNHAHGVLGVLALDGIFHFTRHIRIKRVVAPHSDVGAGVHARAALAHQDLAGVHLLAAVNLHAQAFRLGIAAVPRAAACFLVCHACLLSRSSPGRCL